MKIYGYQKNGELLLEMEEISIRCESKELDDVIDFLRSVRNLMNDHGANFGHEHFNDWRRVKGSSTDGGADIVIAGQGG